MRKPTKNWIDRICLHCTKEFKCVPSMVKKGHGKYCSKKCRNINGGKAATLNIQGENNPNWKGGVSNYSYRYKLIDKKRHPEKHKAREAVKRAKKSGKLIPKPCFICGDDKVEAHHEDYSKPLDVKWMCIKCHHAEHH